MSTFFSFGDPASLSRFLFLFPLYYLLSSNVIMLVCKLLEGRSSVQSSLYPIHIALVLVHGGSLIVLTIWSMLILSLQLPWMLLFFFFSSVHSLSCVWLFVTPRTAAHQASLSITNSQSLLKLMPIELMMPSNHLILCHPLLLLLQFSPASGSFPMSWLFSSGGRSIGASAPMNIPGWFPLGLTGLISLQSKGLSRVFWNTTVQKHQFFDTHPSLWSNSHIYTWLLVNLFFLVSSNNMMSLCAQISNSWPDFMWENCFDSRSLYIH